MLKKLRRRFVLISMSIISLILVFFYLISCAILFVSLTVDMRSVLKTYSSVSSFDTHPQIGQNNEQTSLFALYSGSICVVSVNEFGGIKILDFSRANMDEKSLNAAVDEALKYDSDFGHINSMHLFYNKTPTLIGYRIAFSDSAQYFKYMQSILTDGAVLCVFAFFFLFILTRALAKMSLKPVEKAWQQQKNFIADASHELKTPLTVILTNSNILQSHKDDNISDQMKWVESTYEEATHMKELVDKLLLLAKSDNMSQNNMFTDVNLSELAMQLALQYEPVAFESGVVLYSDIDKDVHLHGDQVALNQIIHILLDNAVKYAGENGEVTLSLKKHGGKRIKKNSGYILLSTTNTGKPIPEDEIPHLFERFYRSDKARTSGNGYGLGLAICKNLAALHNADITVTSDEENGTVFTVKFKLE